MGYSSSGSITEESMNPTSLLPSDGDSDAVDTGVTSVLIEWTMGDRGRFCTDLMSLLRFAVP